MGIHRDQSSGDDDVDLGGKVLTASEIEAASVEFRARQATWPTCPCCGCREDPTFMTKDSDGDIICEGCFTSMAEGGE